MKVFMDSCDIYRRMTEKIQGITNTRQREQILFNQKKNAASYK